MGLTRGVQTISESERTELDREWISQTIRLVAEMVQTALPDDEDTANFNHLASKVADKFSKDNPGMPRHTGATYRNMAALCAQMGDIDRAAVYFMWGAREDNSSPEEDAFYVTNGGTNAWIEFVRNPEINAGMALLTAVEPEATRQLLDEGIQALDLNAFAFIAYLHSLRRHIGFLEEFRTVAPSSPAFSHLQIISGFRNLTALLEIRLRQVIGSTALFHDLLQAGYQKNLAVWARFEEEKRNSGMSSKSTIPYPTRLRYALSPFSDPASHKERFAQSLLVAYIVRNYSTHDMDTDGPLVEPSHARTILGHILNVFTYCAAEKRL